MIDLTKDTLVLLVAIDETNEEIADYMRRMKAARENGVKHVFLTIGGFNDDPRELYQIPEVRAFCRRLVNLGFTSYLDFTTTIGGETGYGWAMAEVWLCANGRGKTMTSISPEELDELEREWAASNERADALIGPFTPRK